MTAPAGSMISPGNDTRHNLTDTNKGGSPRSMPKKVPAAQRGGFGHQGRDRVHLKARMGGARGGTGNPASRAGAVTHDTAHARNPNGGGGVQQRGSAGLGQRGGFGHSGQTNVPNYGPSNPTPGAGNTSGRSYQLIAGRFKRKAMGARPSQGGSYGSPPVTANT